MLWTNIKLRVRWWIREMLCDHVAGEALWRQHSNGAIERWLYCEKCGRLMSIDYFPDAEWIY